MQLIQSLTIPVTIFSLKSILHPMDAINQRYPRKRALYLAGLAQHLCFSESVGSLCYSCLHGNRLRPVLLLKPPGTIVNSSLWCVLASSKFALHLLADAFMPKQFTWTCTCTSTVITRIILASKLIAVFFGARSTLIEAVLWKTLRLIGLAQDHALIRVFIIASN